MPIRPLIAAALFAASTAPALANDARPLPSDAYEQPRHSVVERAGAIELRRYEPMLLAEVQVQGERSAAIREGFKLLAGYIFGGNSGQQSIAMTSPVTQSSRAGEQIAMTSPVTQSANDRGWVVAFMMPSRYTLDTLPKPKSERVQFRVAPAEYRAAVRFSGFSTESNLLSHRTQLLDWVQARGLELRGEPVAAFYDDPFTLPWNRRNEWWVSVAAPVGSVSPTPPAVGSDPRAADPARPAPGATTPSP
jgi:SOUL heme-binding protein